MYVYIYIYICIYIYMYLYTRIYMYMLAIGARVGFGSIQTVRINCRTKQQYTTAGVDSRIGLFSVSTSQCQK